MSLKIKNLTKAFDEKILFSSLSIDFSDRGIYALSGESGIGKTTLLRIIAGLDTDYSGKVIGGGIGYCSMAFQEHRLLPELTVIDNLIFAISDRKDKAVVSKAEEIMQRLGFKKEELLLKPKELSGGMRQRVSIARALLRKSPILLLDEPTKELDEANVKILRDLIKEAAEQRLVILATHSKEDIESLSATIISL